MVTSVYEENVDVNTPVREDVPRVDVDTIERKAFSLHLKTEPFTSDWHHHNKAQLLYAEGGVLHLQTEHHGFLLPAQHGAWIPANMQHRVHSSSPELFLRMLYIDDPHPVEDVLKELSVFPISPLAREMIYHTRIWNNKAEPADAVEESFMQTLRLMLPQWAAASMPLTLPSTDHPRLRPMLDFIIEHLDQGLQVDDLATRFGASTRTVMRLFQNELSISFTTYMRIARIIKALDLFSKPGANVSRVCYEVGYESVSAFSNTFSQLMGMRPNQYLKFSAQQQNL